MTRSQSLTSNYICLIQILQEADCCIDLLPWEQIWLSKGQLIPSRRKSLISLSLLWICSSNKQFCPVSDFWNTSGLLRSRNSSLMASHKYGAACDGRAKQTLSLGFSVSPGDVRGCTSPEGGDQAVADAATGSSFADFGGFLGFVLPPSMQGCSSFVRSRLSGWCSEFRIFCTD